MKNTQNSGKKVQPGKKPGAGGWIAGGAIVVAIAAVVLFKVFSGGGSAPAADLTILKSDVSETVKFYPYQAGGTKMEVLAVKASDGTIRTAFNTCQVCYDSGRGYYEQDGDTLVCQNCGNRFRMDQVEKVKGGCNPVPILDEDKSDDGTNITLSAEFLKQNKDLFGNWKK